MASITLDMSVIAGSPMPAQPSASSSPNFVRGGHRRHTGLVDESNVEVANCCRRAPCPYGPSMSSSESCWRSAKPSSCRAFRHSVVELEHGARRHRRRKNHSDMQPPSGMPSPCCCSSFHSGFAPVATIPRSTSWYRLITASSPRRAAEDLKPCSVRRVLHFGWLPPSSPRWRALDDALGVWPARQANHPASS